MGTIATRLLIAFVIPLALAGCVSGEDENQETKKIAEKVKRQAELSEKAEGSQDLVKDEVIVRKGEKGQPIIEQVGEASSYGQGFHGKKTATGEKFN
jgi:rare lipoprotein A (peptidoglycan hydrolase)